MGLQTRDTLRANLVRRENRLSTPITIPSHPSRNLSPTQYLSNSKMQENTLSPLESKIRTQELLRLNQKPLLLKSTKLKMLRDWPRKSYQRVY